jgi:cyclic pyranopterin phosphate synthase
MPKETFNKDHNYLPQSALLSFDEIERIAAQFVINGVRKIRLTGGEPLLRRNVEELVERLAGLRSVGSTGAESGLDLTMTTNGSLLTRKAKSLKAAGLSRITVSLDALDDSVFRRMNDVNFGSADVLNGIEAAIEAGLGPVKVNMVVKRGSNEQEIIPMIRFFHGTGVVVRFIEYMDVGSTNGWQMKEVMTSDEVVRHIATEFPLVRLPSTTHGETAQRWASADVDGKADLSQFEIGVISSVSHAFCGDCSRARLSTDGKLFLCLFDGSGHDIRSMVRGGCTDMQLAASIRQIWQGRRQRYSEERASQTTESAGVTAKPRVEMSYIGG